MDIQQSYNAWASQYDTNENKTRDLEGITLRKTLSDISFNNCLEIGCGTGKNTEWLVTRGGGITAVDLSEEMLGVAKRKVTSDKVKFIQADITCEWTFITGQYDLVTFSLVLEHIENLDDIFRKVSKVTKDNGFVYIGELHPFKQYSGSKARFETNDGVKVVTCYNHHISDFTAATRYGFEIVSLAEHFDNDDRTSLPRILVLLLRKAGR